MKVSVIGQGYVGLTVSVAAAKAGFRIVGFDTNQAVVKQLIEGKTHVPGILSDELHNLISTNNYLPTSDPKNILDSNIVIIAVPTPLDNLRKPDLTYIYSAITLLSENLSKPALIVNESTSFPGTLRNVIKRELDKISDVKFTYASAPERVDPGNQEWDIYSTPRVVSGLDEESTNQVVEFYKTFCKVVYRAPSCEVAEASKIFENTFRQINIALANEFSLIANVLGFSASEAIKAASTKPFGFMPFYPSIGVGGHCIPIDPSYLSFVAEKSGIKAKFIDLANETNLLMPKKVALKIMKIHSKNTGQIRIQIVGLAYKSNVQDMRESPSIRLIEELRSLGAKVTWFDPIVKHFKGESSTPLDPSVDLGLIITPHDEIDFSIWKNSKTHVLDLSANPNNYGWPKYL
jgi:UDP-N-acetyl-D-glucosamine dehydrogenase